MTGRGLLYDVLVLFVVLVIVVVGIKLLAGVV